MINLLFPILCFIVILLLTEYLSYQGLLEQFSELYLAGPTKCFSCERQMINTYGPEYAWQGKQSKCFGKEQLDRSEESLPGYILKIHPIQSSHYSLTLIV